MKDIATGDFSGRYIHYGIREHGMAAAMNGMALHGGIIPYGGTFMVFSDYCRPSIRLAALMGIRVVYVMTHDSIGLGEDGPTHQPVEHLAAMRAIPGLRVFRPADAVETAECWEIGAGRQEAPEPLGFLAPGPAHRCAPTQVMKICRAKGAYELAGAAGRQSDAAGHRLGSGTRHARRAICLAAEDIAGAHRFDAVLGAVRATKRNIS